MVAGFEIYWRETFRILINRYPNRVKRFKTVDRISFSTSDVRTILGRRLTLGELIACSQTFQNIEAVNRLASDFLGYDFFTEFKERSFRIEPRNRQQRQFRPVNISGDDVFRKHSKDLVKCLELRHNLAHDLPSRVALSPKSVRDMYGSMSSWNVFVGLGLPDQADE